MTMFNLLLAFALYMWAVNAWMLNRAFADDGQLPFREYILSVIFWPIALPYTELMYWLELGDYESKDK